MKGCQWVQLGLRWSPWFCQCCSRCGELQILIKVITETYGDLGWRLSEMDHDKAGECLTIVSNHPVMIRAYFAGSRRLLSEFQPDSENPRDVVQSNVLF